MQTAQEAIAAMQAQALEAIKAGQNAALEAAQTFSQNAAKVAPEAPAMPEVPGLKESVGDPKAIVDSVYDFATALMDLNKNFVHQLLEATQATTPKTK